MTATGHTEHMTRQIMPPRGETTPTVGSVQQLADAWDRAHQEKYATLGGCAYLPSCAESGRHPNPFRAALARRTESAGATNA